MSQQTLTPPTTTAVTLKRAMDDPATAREAREVERALRGYDRRETVIAHWTFSRAKAVRVKLDREKLEGERRAAVAAGKIAEGEAKPDRTPFTTAELIDFGLWLREAVERDADDLAEAVGGAVWYLTPAQRGELALSVLAMLRATVKAYKGRRHETAVDGPPEADADPYGEPPAGEQ